MTVTDLTYEICDIVGGTSELNMKRIRMILSTESNIAKLIWDVVGINLVTCGNCGTILSHKMPNKKEEIQCPYCKYKDEVCHFPDLFY